MTLSAALLCLLLSVVCGLDRTAVLQLMLCRPLVAATLAGWVLGRPALGLETGLVLELLWLARLPVGAAIPPDDTQMALAAAMLAVPAAQWTIGGDAVAVALGISLALALGLPGRWFDHLARQANGALAVLARQRLAADPKAVSAAARLHLRGLGHFALASVSTLLLILLPGLGMLLLLRGADLSVWLPAAEFGLLLCPLIGMAGLLVQWRERSTWGLFIGGFGLAWLAMQLW